MASFAEESLPSAEVPADSASALEVRDPDMLYCCSCQCPTSPDVSIIVVRANHKTPRNIHRCRKCHNLRARIDRVTAKRGELAEDWTAVSETEKQKFFKECSDLAGNELLMKMQETIVHSSVKTSSVKFTGTGTFMDETDLNAKYAGKPQQLEAIKQNTRRLMCPIRRVVMFEDVSFTSATEDQETRTEERKRKVEFTPNTPKPEPKKRGRATDPTKDETDPKLKCHEKKNITKKVEALNTIKLNLKDGVAKARSLQEYVPAYVTEHAGKVLDTIEQAMSMGNDAVGSSAGEMENIMTCLQNAQEEGNVDVTRLKFHTDEAENFKKSRGSR